MTARIHTSPERSSASRASATLPTRVSMDGWEEGPEPLYDLRQLAAIAPLTERQLRRYIERGQLVAGKLGEGRSAKWVVRAGDWEAFVEEGFRAQRHLPDAGVQPRGARAASKTARRVVRRPRAPNRARGAPPPLGSLESLRARSGS